MLTSYYTDQCVVVFGTVSLQRYIFQSNRLKENIGASHLVKYWFDKGLVEAMRQSRLTVHTTEWNAYQKNPSMLPLEKPADSSKDVNVIYVGGGNAALLCKNKDIAQQAVSAWSRRLLEKAPGLRVAVGYGKVSDSLAEAYRRALSNLERCEEALPFGSMLYSLPVIRPCTTTGLPANEPSKEQYEDKLWISQSSARKRDAVGPAQKDITEEFRSVLEGGEHFTVELDNLGGREGQSYIAVVHADGNGIGELLTEVINNSQGDDYFLHNLRAFSASLSQLSANTLTATLEHLKKALPGLRDALSLPDKQIFPLRPIVYGGDDLTFVCDGRIGLSLAAFYLQEFAKGTIRVCDENKSVDACAGVAIVPAKFPFSRAYGFADELCGLAKNHRRDKGESAGSWLDFQIIQEGGTRSIAALREAQYRSIEGHTLHQRPYQVPEKWEDFVSILQDFQAPQWPRSRAKGLLQALTQGPTATKRFVESIKWREMKLPKEGVDDANAVENGWTGAGEEATTPYFDPLEALDFYVQVEPAIPAAARDEETEKEEDG